ncbi:MAG TPA: hypothetical protein VH044_17590 [Polyangiaceae bacterium]|jgi:hypothetical protein|nr:hypothetical protein [Polyangiaceae bacterium]
MNRSRMNLSARIFSLASLSLPSSGPLVALAMLAALAVMPGCSQAVHPTPPSFSETEPDAADTDPGTTSDDASSGASSGDAGMLGGWHPGAADGGVVADGGDGGGAGPVVTTVVQAIGPIALAPAQETTVCITVRLSNKTAVYVPRITVDLALGSHHLVTYRSMATTESPTPTACTAFQGILSGNAVPLMITEKLADELTFPQGVALKIEENQMIELEAHYINTGSTTLQGSGKVRFDTVPITTDNVIESDLGFFGTSGIILGPGSGSVGPMFVAGLAGTHGFALTTHQHRLGTDFKIWFANSATDVNHAPVADTTDWANPPLYRMNPEMDFNGTNGLAYQCTWDNTTGQIVTFGESALQEMCFLWMYYYPSHGFDMRFQ